MHSSSESRVAIPKVGKDELITMMTNLPIEYILQLDIVEAYPQMMMNHAQIGVHSIKCHRDDNVSIVQVLSQMEKVSIKPLH